MTDAPVAQPTRLLVIMPQANKLLTPSPVVTSDQSAPEQYWNAKNIAKVCRFLQPNSMLVIGMSSAGFHELDELRGEKAWEEQGNISRVVIHGRYDFDQGETAQIAIEFNRPGATVHILSDDYYASDGTKRFRATAFDQFLARNAGFGDPAEARDDSLRRGTACCDFDAVIKCTDWGNTMLLLGYTEYSTTRNRISV